MTDNGDFHSELLLDYASGAAEPSAAAVLGAYVTLNPRARSAMHAWEQIGGALLEQDRPRAGLTAPTPPPAVALAGSLDEAAPASVAQLLREWRDGGFRDVPWKRFWPGLSEHDLPAIPGAKLYKFRAGRKIFAHRHDGLELTLVLAGGFRDDLGWYGPGDLAVADETRVHAPVIDEGEDCICLVSLDGEPRLAGAIGSALDCLNRAFKGKSS